MEESVLAAQRAYGDLLARSGSPQALALAETARSAYQEVLARAAEGNPECQRECLRIASETKTLTDLSIGTSALMVALPPEQAAQTLRQRTFTVSELIGVVQALSSQKRDTSEFTEALVQLAMQSSDTQGLMWVSENTKEPQRSQAFASYGRVLAKRAGILTTRSLGTATERYGEHTALVEEIEQWLSRTAKYKNVQTLTSELAASAKSLRSVGATLEAEYLLAEMAGCFARPVTDLATWTARVQHLTRRMRNWLSTYPSTAENRLRSTVEAEAQRAESLAREWGQKYSAPVGFGPGQAVPAPTGACRYCAGWSVGPKFCRQCGAPRSSG